MVEVTTPPTMGAAILFMMSEPAPWLNMTGIRPARITLTVMILGLILFTAPMHDSILEVSHRFQHALPLPFQMGKLQVKEHHHARLRIEPARAIMPTHTAMLIL